MRSGEAMEQGLRDCCRSIRIGKILIQSDEETQRAKVYYAKFPPDIYRRKVLLMYPILNELSCLGALIKSTDFSAQTQQSCFRAERKFLLQDTKAFYS
ncbi:uracil phosphoribosyltransferase homolog isoform X2 [Pezoporus flaviventris]|uniref:uracil phosphoribosyltransferase homolog isoform X2 n=1 Tax=Pezoporus flaviventris TaxID=889875 RepID=UPI002AB131DC|nr:uracil phosphoribosyltransferase homolog isoform X2 [Pezoporus flaviventris]